jgi:hypothetical protein
MIFESVVDIYTDTLKYVNADVFNIPFTYYFNRDNNITSVNTDMNTNGDVNLDTVVNMNIMHMIYIFTCTFVALLVGYLFYYYKPELDNINEINSDNDSDNNSDMEKKQNGKSLIGLYTESINEIIQMNNIIVDKMQSSKDKKTMYWVLLRVQMKNPLDMNKTKFELHGNHTGDSNAAKFSTKDVFMIMKFIYHKGDNGPITKNIGNILINFMNYYNILVEEKYKTNDFIVVAISQMEDNTNPKEFYSGLIANEYEMNNYHDVVFTTPRSNIKVGYVLTLPIHQVYDIFLDVFPNVIFETKYYEMDNNNCESWKGIAMNELSF